MWNAFVTLPLQIVCQLVGPGINGTGNGARLAVDTQSPVKNAVLPTYNVQTPNQTTVLPETPRLSKRISVIPEGYTAFPDIGVAYKCYTEQLPWNSARKKCIVDGGIFAEIDTLQKIGYAMSLSSPRTHRWVGIHRLFDDGEWTSVKTGQQLSTIPWASYSRRDDKKHDCMLIYSDGSGLTATRCTENQHFICEISLLVD